MELPRSTIFLTLPNTTAGSRAFSSAIHMPLSELAGCRLSACSVPSTFGSHSPTDPAALHTTPFCGTE